MIAYASAYLKCNYLSAFTAAILNNQPMGFYQPFTLIKDAQRLGLMVLPVDLMKSDWLCTIEEEQKGEKGEEGKGGKRPMFKGWTFGGKRLTPDRSHSYSSPVALPDDVEGSSHDPPP